MLTLILSIAAIGFVTWLILKLIPMPAPFPQVVIALACIFILLLILRAFGLVGSIGTLRI